MAQNEKQYIRCNACNGGGVIPCFYCEGRGQFSTVSYGFTTSTKPCAACHGTGIKQTCKVCEGKGYRSYHH